MTSPTLIQPGSTDYEPFIVPLPQSNGLNPSIVRWQGRLLMIWRQGWCSGRLWMGELDAQFQLRWSRELDFSRVMDLEKDDWLEDPRLIAGSRELRVAFSYVRGKMIAMCLATLDAEGTVLACEGMGGVRQRWEKNWQFFEDGSGLKAVYYFSPHCVGRRKTEGWAFPPAHGALLKWPHGEVRGGTPPVRIGEEMFSFFHSSVNYRYVAGFYAFEAEWPHRVTRWPTAPCLLPKDNPHSPPASIIFPGGAVFDEAQGEWLLAYGWQDRHCCLGRFSHADLLAGLVTRTNTPAARRRENAVKIFPARPLPALREEQRRESQTNGAHHGIVAVKLVTAFVDLNRMEQRPQDKSAAAYVARAAELFAFGGPLLVWLDCDAETEAALREAAKAYVAIEFRPFRVEEMELWQEAAAAGDLELPAERNAVKDSRHYLVWTNLKTELVARSIAEGCIPAGMETGWIDIGVSHMPGIGASVAGKLQRMVRTAGSAIRIPGLHPPKLESEAAALMCGTVWNFTGAFFAGPQGMLVEFATAARQAFRRLLHSKQLTWEANLWSLVWKESPDLFDWYRAGFDPRLLDACPGAVATTLSGLRLEEIANCKPIGPGNC
jgi:hypothetical protein